MYNIDEIVKVDFEQFENAMYKNFVEIDEIEYNAEFYGNCTDDCYHCNSYADDYQYCPRRGNTYVKITGYEREPYVLCPMCGQHTTELHGQCNICGGWY